MCGSVEEEYRYDQRKRLTGRHRRRKKMEVEMVELYIDNILLTTWDNNLQKSFSYKNSQINSEVIKSIKESIEKNMLTRLELENTKTDISITVFCENGLSFFGIVDMYNDINYYYNNLSNDTTLVEIEGNVFEKWMVCESNDILWEAIIFFAFNGKCSPQITWSEE